VEKKDITFKLSKTTST